LAPAAAAAPATSAGNSTDTNSDSSSSTTGLAALAAVTAVAGGAALDAVAATEVAAATAGTDSAKSDGAAAANAASSADLSALASLVRGMSAGSTQPATAVHSIPVAVSDPSWPHAVATQVQMFAAANIQSATLRLSPEHLGPVEVHIDMQPSQINVSFVAAHAETRNALEQSVPMLRAMLAHGGLTLGQTQVQGETRSGSHLAGSRPNSSAGNALGEQPIVAGVTRSVGLVDEYA
jgi:flagellar hook-length control protein FliK